EYPNVPHYTQAAVPVQESSKEADGRQTEKPEERPAEIHEEETQEDQNSGTSDETGLSTAEEPEPEKSSGSNGEQQQ
ncbi:MAG: hypothetical protein J6T99_00670, partial [Oscillospiraceae bacterium]|nr:hypothetical protein [Oscillospiraceae bacterium]